MSISRCLSLLGQLRSVLLSSSLLAWSNSLQLMDPKMDTGYLAEGDTLEDEYDIARHLLPEEVLGIMDQLMCLEVNHSYPKQFSFDLKYF